MSDKPEYLVRNSEGILCQSPSVPFGARYKQPDEAIKTWWEGKLRFGCNEGVFSEYRSHPCGNSAKHDPDANGNPTKCGHHSAATKERKRQKRDERDAARRAIMDRRNRIHRLNLERDEIIRKIADDHNDPRSLCQDWLRRMGEVQTDHP